jgi:hypothetical protein
MAANGSASKQVNNAGRFQKGHKQYHTRQRGERNIYTRVLKTATLLAAEIVGDKLHVALANHEDPVQQLKAQRLVGYLEWAALNQPKAFIGMLGRVLPLQQQHKVEFVHPQLLKPGSTPEQAMRAYLDALKIIPTAPLALPPMDRSEAEALEAEAND